MRPSSAGSSRISKRVLPLWADAAISTANPLNGTAAPGVAAVTVGVGGAAWVVAAICCGNAAACTLGSGVVA
jgi:hypothetical protein